jgi:hypothetical protein
MRIKYFTLTAVFMLLTSGHLLATPASQSVVSNKVVSASANIFAQSLGDNLVKLRVGDDHAPINIVSFHITYGPGGFSGWHSHSGPGFVIVVA